MSIRLEKAIHGLLLVMRAQLDIAIAMLEGDEEPAAGPSVATCEHPEDQRLDTSTAGNPATFLCGVCGAELEGIA